MKINIDTIQGVEVIKPIGDVDMATSPDIREHFLRMLKKSPAVIVIDMSEVNYIDSSGVATFVECLQGLIKHNGVLRISNLKENVLDVFKLARLDTIFELYKTLEDALKA